MQPTGELRLGNYPGETTREVRGVSVLTTADG
jgi:hypothetical protein